MFDTHSFRICLQINTAQLCLLQTEQRLLKLEMKNKSWKNSQGASDRKHTNWNDLSGRLISANIFYPKLHFNSNQHNHQQAVLADSLVGVSPVLQFYNLYSSCKQHFHCIAAFLIHVNMSSVSLDVITSLFYELKRLFRFQTTYPHIS